MGNSVLELRAQLAEAEAAALRARLAAAEAAEAAGATTPTPPPTPTEAVVALHEQMASATNASPSPRSAAAPTTTEAPPRKPPMRVCSSGNPLGPDERKRLLAAGETVQHPEVLAGSNVCTVCGLELMP